MRHVNRQLGFTIVEFMISTAVFSMVLLVILTAITQVGRMYYKGITNAKTQEATRNTIDRVAQEIQYSGSSGVPVNAEGATTRTKLICIGNSRYFFKIDQRVDGDNHAIWYDNAGENGSKCSNSDADGVNLSAKVPTVGGAELLPEGTRVVAFSVSLAQDDLFSVNVKVVYGSDDLLEWVDAAGESKTQQSNPELATCRGSAVGTQFCATSELSTVVLKRVPQI